MWVIREGKVVCELKLCSRYADYRLGNEGNWNVEDDECKSEEVEKAM